MKNLPIASAVIVSAAWLVLSTPSFAYTDGATKPALIVDPISGVVEGTTNIVTGLGQGTFGAVSGVEGGTGGLFTMGWNRPSMQNQGRIYRGINNDTPYLVTETGVQSPGFSYMNKGTHYTITDMDNGRRYRVVRLKTGTMDVMRGNKVTRYQYIQPVVRPL